MGLGRIVCVALPFALTVASLICLLVAGLAGVTDKNLYLFRANVTDLQFNPTSVNVHNLVNLNNFIPRDLSIDTTALLLNKDSESNVTAADLGLGALYDISLWGYCVTDQKGNRTCEKPTFNWASNIVNATVQQFKTAAALANQNVVLPDAVETGMKGFAQLAKWTEIVYISCMACLGVEILFGIFATCSRVGSCLTFLVNGITSFVVIAFATLATVMAAVVVGVIKGTAHWYGVEGSISAAFLAWAWLGVAFALGAGFFWMFTICCCASSHHSPKKRGGFRAHSEGEKAVPTGAYQPLGEQHEMAPPFYSSGAQYGGARKSVGPHDTAYEPYSHNRV